MRGLFYDPTIGGARLRRDLPIPEPGAGEARVRLRLAGICRTDLEITRGYVPFTGVLGHEFVGTVDAAPGTEGLHGARVVGEINAACGTCEACRAGRPRHCTQRTVLGIDRRDGCLADFLVLPVANLRPVPDSVPDDAAVFAEPLAAAFRIPEQLPLGGEEQTLVLGDGKLGLLVAMVLRRRVGRLLLAGRHPEKLAIASRAGVATALASEVRESGFDLVVECTGRAEGLREALGRVRPLGTLVLKTTVAGDTSAPLSAAVVNEVTMLGSRCGPFEPALEALSSGQIDPRPLIAARYGLDRAEEAITHASQAGVLKVLVEP